MQECLELVTSHCDKSFNAVIPTLATALSKGAEFTFESRNCCLNTRAGAAILAGFE